MKKPLFIFAFAVAIDFMLGVGQLMAEEIRVAVASNFGNAIKGLSQSFEQKTGHKVTLIFGSTGKHYAQIKNGAPFDAFFAADSKRPELLEKEGLASPGTRFTYAIGKLILWSPKKGYVEAGGRVLEKMSYRRLAIANPKLAPYGKAAQEVLQSRELWGALKGNTVRGENIAQTFQFIQSGNVELGFVAYSQVKRPGHTITGSWWEVPQVLYTPIAQQAVLLKDKETVREFLAFVKREESLKIIRDFGYDTP